MQAALSPRGTTLIVSVILTATFFALSGCSTLGIADRAHAAENAAWQAAARSDAVSEAYLQRLLVQRDDLLIHIDRVMAVNDSLKNLGSPPDSTMFSAPSVIIRSTPQEGGN